MTVYPTTDPWDELREWLTQHERVTMMRMAELERRAGVPATMLDKWYHRRPHGGKPRTLHNKHLVGIYTALHPFGFLPSIPTPTTDAHP